jgi:hypothetical protein
MWLRLGHILCLGAFLPLDYFKFDGITFLKALVPFRLDGAVVNKDIGTIITTDKPEAFSVVEPLNCTFNSRHVPYSTGPSEHGQTCVPGPSLISLGLPLLKGGTQVAEGNDTTSLPHSISTSYTRHWLFLILRLFRLLCQLTYLKNHRPGLSKLHAANCVRFFRLSSIGVF